MQNGTWFSLKIVTTPTTMFYTSWGYNVSYITDRINNWNINN